MQSFSNFAETIAQVPVAVVESVAGAAEGAVGTATSGVSGGMNMNVLVMALVPALLFLILTPGFLLNVGGISQGRCTRLVPLPDDATGVCDFANDGYLSSGGGDYNAEQLLKLCTAQRRCNRWFVSGYTGPWPIALHTVVFLLLAGGLSYYMAMSKY